MASKNLFELLKNSREKKNQEKETTPTSKPPVSQGKIENSKKESLELDQFPLEEIYYSKAYTFRMDTLMMAGILSCVLLLISFFIGRLSVGTQKMLENKSKVVTVVQKMTLPKKSLAIAKKTSVQKIAQTRDSKIKGKYELRVLTSPTKKGAEEVVEHLTKNGFHAYIHHGGRSYQVRISGFEKQERQALHKVRKLLYKGRTWFDTAYFAKLR